MHFLTSSNLMACNCSQAFSSCRDLTGLWSISFLKEGKINSFLSEWKMEVLQTSSRSYLTCNLSLSPYPDPVHFRNVGTGGVMTSCFFKSGRKCEQVVWGRVSHDHVTLLGLEKPVGREPCGTLPTEQWFRDWGDTQRAKRSPPRAGNRDKRSRARLRSEFN